MSEIRQEPEMIQNSLWTKGLVKRAGKIIVYVLMLGILSLLIAPVLMIENSILRVGLNLLMLFALGALVYSDAGSRGQREVAFSVTLAKRKATGAAVTDEDVAKCYHPMRGVAVALLGALPFFLLAVALALLATPITYSLQDLPSWLQSYARRADLGSALIHYNNLPGPELQDYLRIGVRLAIMPMSYIVGGFGDQASLLLDRMGPLLVLILPAMYAIGYLRGPALNRMVIKRNEEAKRLHKKKVARKKKREHQARAQKGPERLI